MFPIWMRDKLYLLISQVHMKAAYDSKMTKALIITGRAWIT